MMSEPILLTTSVRCVDKQILFASLLFLAKPESSASSVSEQGPPHSGGLNFFWSMILLQEPLKELYRSHPDLYLHSSRPYTDNPSLPLMPVLNICQSTDF